MKTNLLCKYFFETKLDKVICILCSIFFLATISLIAIPTLREVIITLGETYKSRTLNHPHWHEKISQLCQLFLFYTFSAYAFYVLVSFCIKNNYSYQKIWCVLNLTCIVLLITAIFLFGGELISQFLFYDRLDTGMDYFHCLATGSGSGQYPGLANLFYKFSQHCVKDAFVSNPETARYFRLEQAALFPFIIQTIMVSLGIVFLGTYIFGSTRKGLFDSFLILSCYSVLFAMERGNIVFPAFMFLLAYIVFYKSENKILRELALISLAISFGLKLYPAVFGMLLLTEKRWKDVGRCCIYALIIFFVPEAILQILSKGSYRELSSFFYDILDWGTYLFLNFAGKNIFLSIVMIACIIFAIVLLLLLLFKTNKHWLKVYICGVLSITIGMCFQYPYAYQLLIPSFLLFMIEDTKNNKINSIYYLFMLIIHLPLPIFRYFNPYLNLIGFIKVIATVILTLIIIVNETYEIRKNTTLKAITE